MRRSSHAAATMVLCASALLACTSRTGPSAPPVDTRPACVGPDARLDESRGDGAPPGFHARLGTVTTLHVTVTVNGATRLDSATFAVMPPGDQGGSLTAGSELAAVPVPVATRTAALSFRSATAGVFPVMVAMEFTTTRDCGTEEPLRDPFTQRFSGETTLATITVG